MEEFNEFFGTINSVLIIFIFILSFIQCFLGLKLVKFTASIVGAFIFGNIGMIIGSGTNFKIILTIILAIIGLIISYKLYKLGAFLLCGAFGFGIGWMIGMSFSRILSVVLAISFGLLFIAASIAFLEKVIIISTGFAGGFTIGLSVCGLLGSDANTIAIIIGVIIGAFGISFQMLTNKNKIKKQPLLNTNTTKESPMQNDNIISFDICKYCGSAVKPTADFCEKCGGALHDKI